MYRFLLFPKKAAKLNLGIINLLTLYKLELKKLAQHTVKSEKYSCFISCIKCCPVADGSLNIFWLSFLQFVFCEDGFAGLCFEHTSAEGPAVIGLCDHALDYM